MNAIFVLSCLGVPCAIFLVYCLTPSGRRWLKNNNMI